jgi:putative integral membrane protein (TIGR02587 family)
MEMWRLGFYMDRLRLAVLLILSFPLLVGLSYWAGMEETFSLKEDVRDALVAIAIGASASAAILWLFGVLAGDQPLGELLGKVALQSIPAAIGALLARTQLGGEKAGEGDGPKPGYFGELFLMAVGAVFLALNVAPTEEMVLISYLMSAEQVLALAALSLAIMHAFVYAVGFHGQHERPEDATFWGLFFRFTAAGYALVLLISLYVLWTFGRTDGSSLVEVLSAAIVLAFPGAVGAAAARLLL